MINELISYKIQHSCTNIKYQLPFYSLPQTIYVRNAEKMIQSIYKIKNTSVGFDFVFNLLTAVHIVVTVVETLKTEIKIASQS